MFWFLRDILPVLSSHSHMKFEFVFHWGMNISADSPLFIYPGIDSFLFISILYSVYG